MYLIQICKKNTEHLLLTSGAVGMLSGKNCNQLITRNKARQKSLSEITVYDFPLAFFPSQLSGLLPSFLLLIFQSTRTNKLGTVFPQQY